MLTVQNAAYGLSNVIESLEEILAVLSVCVATNTLAAFPYDTARTHITVASMQLSALSDDFDHLVMNEDSTHKLEEILNSGTKYQ